jgi:4a-hydroxytetrahydrobiopterin dehydratase
MGHHPVLSLSWDEVTVSITNHAAGGLTESDFTLAKRIDGVAAK